jgi:acetoin utilization deacetylase AcuC-like enzyme
MSYAANLGRDQILLMLREFGADDLQSAFDRACLQGQLGTARQGHRFPMEKYRLLRERVVAAGVVGPEELIVPHAATDEEILRVHDPEYLRRMVRGEMDRAEMRRIGFPWSPEMVERSRRSAGGTIEACRAALDDGAADAEYLGALEAGLQTALEAAEADFAIYVSGADPHERDRLGRLKVSRAGLLARDRMVFERCGRQGLPVAVVMAGGYNVDVAETVEVHLQTVTEARRYGLA